MRKPMTPEELQELADATRQYARSKGLTMVGQGIAFAAGLLPLLYTARRASDLPTAQAGGLYLASGAVFLFLVWVGLKATPEFVERMYYMRVGGATASAPVTPDWARFLAPLCVFAPIFCAGTGVLDAWQATVIGLLAFGLHMYCVGKWALREPATEMIGAVTILLGGAIAGEPRLAVVPSVQVNVEWLQALLEAQCTALGMAGWLLVAWLIAAVATHIYNRWLLRELGLRRRGE